jgi:hypothetical protein
MNGWFSRGGMLELPDAEGAEVAQKTQKRQKRFLSAFSLNSAVIGSADLRFLFCVFCATSAPFASGI